MYLIMHDIPTTILFTRGAFRVFYKDDLSHSADGTSLAGDLIPMMAACPLESIVTERLNPQSGLIEKLPLLVRIRHIYYN